MTPSDWRLVAALAPYRIRGMSCRAWFAMGWINRAKREARS